jgi:hypothetical protein
VPSSALENSDSSFRLWNGLTYPRSKSLGDSTYSNSGQSYAQDFDLNGQYSSYKIAHSAYQIGSLEGKQKRGN